MLNIEPTPEDYLKWYDQGLITIFPLMLNGLLIIIVIPVPQN